MKIENTSIIIQEKYLPSKETVIAIVKPILFYLGMLMSFIILIFNGTIGYFVFLTFGQLEGTFFYCFTSAIGAGLATLLLVKGKKHSFYLKFLILTNFLVIFHPTTMRIIERTVIDSFFT
ncbi:hypothetical protein LCL95_09715 [Bacillus timonensis]|nr:hypothetical protein [Bacillus timonensis]